MFKKCVMYIIICMQLFCVLPDVAYAGAGRSDGANDQPWSPTIDYSYKIREGYASTPQCYWSTSDIAAWAKSVISLFQIFISGVRLYRTAKALGPGTPWSAAMKASAVGIMVTAATMSLSMIYGSVAPMCFFSFVRNPVQRYSENLNPEHPDYQHRGKMKKRVSALDAVAPKYAPTDKYWEAEEAPYSDSLQLCMRYPNLINFGFGIGCEKGDYATSTDGDLYRGGNSRLCPEEWNSLGVEFELVTISENPLQVQQRVKRKSDGSYSVYDPALYVESLKFMKYNSSPTSCSGPFKKSAVTHIHGYTFQVNDGGENGTKMCAYLVGFGAMPYAPQMQIGCHYRENIKVYPKCPASKPIREDGDWDSETQTIVPGTGTGKIISYDNSDCMSCTISSVCVGQGDMRPHKALIPFTSIAYRCVRETFESLVFGCEGESTDGGGETHVPATSHLATIQVRLLKFVQVTITLAIAAFSLGVITGGAAQLSRREIISFLLKIAFVLWCTYTDDNGNGGMQFFSKAGQAVADTLMEYITLSVAPRVGPCSYEPDSYLITTDGVQKDYRYLIPWDMMDCYVAHMFGMPMANRYVLQDDNAVPVLNLPFVLNLLIMMTAIILGGPFVPLLLLGIFIFAIMVLVFVIWTVQIAIMSFVSFAVLILVSPIFLVTIFFNTTKQMYEGWMRETIAYLFTQILVVAYLAFILSCVNLLYFGHTEFEAKEVYFTGRKVMFFFIKAADTCSAEGELVQGEVPCGCDRESLGCWLSGVKFVTKSIMFGLQVTGFEMVDSTMSFEEAAIRYLTLSLLMWLFFEFYQSLFMSIVVELGGARGLFEMSGAAISQGSVLGKIRDSATSIGDKLLPGGGGKGKKGADGGDGGGKGGDGDAMHAKRDSGAGGNSDSMRPKSGGGADNAGSSDAIRQKGSAGGGPSDGGGTPPFSSSSDG